MARPAIVFHDNFKGQMPTGVADPAVTGAIDPAVAEAAKDIVTKDTEGKASPKDGAPKK